MNALKILELKAENVKRLQAVHIKPNGESVVIGGDNDQGKSSVLDSILYAIGGERAICDEPLRRGQKKGEVTVDLGEFVITRKFTEGGGGSLVVRSRDGAVQPSPQRILDQLVGKLSFDPLKFMAMDAKAQRECLAQLAELDFAKINADYDGLYAERTDANREAARLQAQWTAKTFVAGLQSEEISVTDLMTELDMAQAHNAEVAERLRVSKAAQQEAQNAAKLVERQEAIVATVRAELAEAEGTLASLVKAGMYLIEQAKIAAAACEPDKTVDETPIKDSISRVGELNTVIRSNAEYKRIQSEHSKAAALANHLDHECKAVLNKKQKMVEEAKFPLVELSVSDDAVLYDGIPLKQAATSKQILVSASIGIALNPTLRVMFIREGSLLDLTALQGLYDLAYMQNVQLWIERVSKGDEVSVIIEDGAVAANRISPSTPKPESPNKL